MSSLSGYLPTLTKQSSEPKKICRPSNSERAPMSRLDLITNWCEYARATGYSVSRLAKRCRVSPSQLRRFFMKSAGMSPHDWLNQLRLWRAMELLRKGLSVKEVATALHFCSSSHFCNSFKQYHGCTPSSFLYIYNDRIECTRRKFSQLEPDTIFHPEPWAEAEKTLERRLRHGYLKRANNCKGYESN